MVQPAECARVAPVLTIALALVSAALALGGTALGLYVGFTHGAGAGVAVFTLCQVLGALFAPDIG